MIEKTVKKIEETVDGATTISEEKRAQLAILISELKSEIIKLSETDTDSAMVIAQKTHASAHHATQQNSEDPQFTDALDDLKSAVDTFEASHPGLVSTVNAFCNALSDLGI